MTVPFPAHHEGKTPEQIQALLKLEPQASDIAEFSLSYSADGFLAKALSMDDFLSDDPKVNADVMTAVVDSNSLYVREIMGRPNKYRKVRVAMLNAFLQVAAKNDYLETYEEAKRQLRQEGIRGRLSLLALHFSDPMRDKDIDREIMS